MTEPNNTFRKQKLIVIADRQTSLFFTLVGAVGFEIDYDSVNSKVDVQTALKPAMKFIRSNVRNIGAILVADHLADVLIDRVERMRGIEIPIVQLPNRSGDSQAARLELIMEKAVGMKLDFSSFSSTTKN